jgi:hypothetical protein
MYARGLIGLFPVRIPANIGRADPGLPIAEGRVKSTTTYIANLHLYVVQ